MEAWNQSFAQMKAQYIIKSTQRLEQIDTLIAALEQMPSDIDVMRQVLRHFHWLAGSGGIYDLPTITDVGCHGEKYCDNIIANKAIFQDGDRQHLKMLVATARKTIEGQSKDPSIEIKSDRQPSSIELDVMLVEDDEAVSKKLTTMLELEGLLVRDHRSIFAAQRAIRERIPKGLIISVKNIDKTVYETVEKIRMSREGIDTVVVLVEKIKNATDRILAMYVGIDKIIDPSDASPQMIREFRQLINGRRPPPYKVLSVEDDPDQVAYIRAVLESIGCNVETEMDPDHFAEKLNNFAPELLLLDINLGDVTGFDLATYVRQDKKYADLPIIFLSTLTFIESKIQAQKLGAEDYLVKPVSRERLAATIATKAERARILNIEKIQDGLTHVANYSHWMQELQQLTAIPTANTPRRKFVMLVLDIDDFKSVNASFGFAAGDLLITSLADLMRSRLRNALIGRHGPDSIAAIMEGISENDTVTLAKMLVDKFSSIEHKSATGVSFYGTCSAAIAASQEYDFSVLSWVAAANQGMAMAKERGRSSIITNSQRF